MEMYKGTKFSLIFYYNKRFTIYIMNCIFCCLFDQEKYINMFYILLESIFIYGNLDVNTHILVYTTTQFMNTIKQSHLFCDEKIKFEINDAICNDNSRKAMLDLFNLPSTTNYDKIVYLDTNIVVKDDINKVFDICKEDILYVLEGEISCDSRYLGKNTVGDEVINYDDKSAFASGILLCNNCEKMKYLFEKIKEDIDDRPDNFNCFDQSYMMYNIFKYNLYNNTILKTLVVNNNTNIHSDKAIHCFPGGNCNDYKKNLLTMNTFLNSIKDFTITNNINKSMQYIDDYLLPIINNYGEPLEGNIFMYHHTTTYTDIFENKRKNISNLVLNKNIKNVIEIGFNSGFSTLLMLLSNKNTNVTCFDLGYHKYTIPCFEKLKETFGDRINIIIGDSTKTLQNINDVYDLIHIDGGHSTNVANSDIINSYRLSKQGTILIMDDYNHGNLHELWDNYINEYNLKQLDINIYTSKHHDIKYVVK